MNILKIVRKKGYRINPDDDRVNEIIRGLYFNDGHCITIVKHRKGHDQCPCSDYLQNDICHCGLYVKENEKDVKKDI